MSFHIGTDEFLARLERMPVMELRPYLYMTGHEPYSREWRPMPDLASKIAAPVWALAWVVSGGRMGLPLWRCVSYDEAVRRRMAEALASQTEPVTCP